MLEEYARASVNLDLNSCRLRDINIEAQRVEVGILINRADEYARPCFQLFPSTPVSEELH